MAVLTVSKAGPKRPAQARSVTTLRRTGFRKPSEVPLVHTPNGWHRNTSLIHLLLESTNRRLEANRVVEQDGRPAEIRFQHASLIAACERIGDKFTCQVIRIGLIDRCDILCIRTAPSLCTSPQTNHSVTVINPTTTLASLLSVPSQKLLTHGVNGSQPDFTFTRDNRKDHHVPFLQTVTEVYQNPHGSRRTCRVTSD